MLVEFFPTFFKKQKLQFAEFFAYIKIDILKKG
jgi:hypothetical protein